ncbi:DoxX family protein [Ottowia sp.]|uniref:DoxX family protein n=1 Tax=Ottowia sp. TaxID=1898956 RepID=UPI002C23D2EB|nr:DoxX family protein [Ottowia sp.]HOB66652.1 DoxX family protein [Ottowia sp.]HPZ56974.1 DoxX family protein [Ottowia sp.]HQD47465.1 DoxX family protein [Ottowia sp.]
MMNALQNPLALLGRLLLAYVFIPAGIGKLGAGFAGTVGYIASKGLPMPEVLAVAAIVVEIGAGIALLIGWQTRWAALALALFTLMAALFFHNFWGVPADQVMTQKLMFTKNLGIAGGLLAIAALGGGALGLDGRRRG